MIVPHHHILLYIQENTLQSRFLHGTEVQLISLQLPGWITWAFFEMNVAFTFPHSSEVSLWSPCPFKYDSGFARTLTRSVLTFGWFHGLGAGQVTPDFIFTHCCFTAAQQPFYCTSLPGFQWDTCNNSSFNTPVFPASSSCSVAGHKSP